MTINKIARITGIEETELKVILDGMSDKGLVFDIPRKDSFYLHASPNASGILWVYFYADRRPYPFKDLAVLFEAYFHIEGVMK